jgi:hypothetical protein
MKKYTIKFTDGDSLTIDADNYEFYPQNTIFYVMENEEKRVILRCSNFCIVYIYVNN